MTIERLTKAKREILHLVEEERPLEALALRESIIVSFLNQISATVWMPTKDITIVVNKEKLRLIREIINIDILPLILEHLI